MRLTRLIAPLALGAIPLGLLIGPALAAGASGSGAPVIEIAQKQFGRVLATPSKHALYTWNREKDHKVHCTGTCAKTWPPITLARGTRVAAHYAGVMGTFGTIRRPDGQTQLTWDRQPAYTFSGDGPTQVKCNGVDGWFVAKA